MPPRVDLRILGPFELAVDGRPVPIGSAKQRLLLARLAAELNRPVPAETLITTLWGESPPPSVETTLRSLISRLRRLLADLPGADPVALAGCDIGYMLQADVECLDGYRFELDVATAHRLLASGEPAEAARCFAAGLERWRGGPALPELADDEETRPEIARLEEARLAAIEGLADADLAAGRPDRAQAVLETLVAAHPLREAAWGRLMVALYRQARQADALRVFQRARELLVEQLGLEPGPDLRRLEEQILNQSPELDGPGGASHDTVAFLFTDIEASTRRWEGDHRAMGVDLTRHDDTLRAQVEQAGGASSPTLATGCAPRSARRPPPSPPPSPASRHSGPSSGKGRSRSGSGWRSMPGPSRRGATTGSGLRSTGPPACWRWAGVGRSSAPGPPPTWPAMIYHRASGCGTSANTGWPTSPARSRSSRSTMPTCRRCSRRCAPATRPGPTCRGP